MTETMTSLIELKAVAELHRGSLNHTAWEANKPARIAYKAAVAERIESSKVKVQKVTKYATSRHSYNSVTHLEVVDTGIENRVGRVTGMFLCGKTASETWLNKNEAAEVECLGCLRALDRVQTEKGAAQIAKLVEKFENR
jgi:hypothetical protein